MKKLSMIFAFVSFAVFSTYAQYGSVGTTDARSMGMGNTYTAVSQGVYAIGINPANLLNDNNFINFSTVLPLPSISLKSGTNFISINDINYFFGGVNGQSRELTAADKQRLNSLFANGGLILGNASVNIFSFELNLGEYLGAFAFSVNDAIGGNITIPHALSELVLSGNPLGSSYNFDDTRASSWWIRDYSLSYARVIPNFLKNTFDKITAGISVKYVQGFEFIQSEKTSNNFIQTDNNGDITLSTNYRIQSAFSDNFGVQYSFDSTVNNDSHFSPFPSTAGSGFGIDLGFRASMGKQLNLALAITDIGSITWDKNTALTYSTGSYTITDFTNKATQDSINNLFNGESKSISGFTTGLPTALRLGATYRFNFAESQFPGTLLLAMDINKGFNDLPGNSQKTRVSIGSEWKPMDWMPYIRSGFSFGGLFGFHWALGLGIDAGLLEFNFSTQDFQSIAAPNSAKYISFAFDSRWKL